jgi:S1-C subfamily serine protease
MLCKRLPLWIAFTVAGCAHYVVPNDSQRIQSFQSIVQSGQTNRATELLIKQRTAVIINGHIEVAEAIGSGQTLGIRFRTVPRGYVNGPSHAVAIDSRGYFLTAAHCLNEPSIYLIYFDGQSAQIAVPRIVAKIQDCDKQLDFAVIHVDATLPYVFEWSSSKELMPGRVAVAAGSGSLHADSDTQALCTEMCMGGKISSTIVAGNGAAIIYHDLPLRPGDSGGPLATVVGNLLGLETGVRVAWTGTATSVAVRPDPVWVAHVIEDDMKVARQITPEIPVLKNEKAANLVVSLW